MRSPPSSLTARSAGASDVAFIRASLRWGCDPRPQNLSPCSLSTSAAPRSRRHSSSMAASSRARASGVRPAPTRSAAELDAAVTDVVREALGSTTVTRVGIGSAGPVDTVRGLVSPLNVPAWRDHPLRDVVAAAVPGAARRPRDRRARDHPRRGALRRRSRLRQRHGNGRVDRRGRRARARRPRHLGRERQRRAHRARPGGGIRRRVRLRASRLSRGRRVGTEFRSLGTGTGLGGRDRRRTRGGRLPLAGCPRPRRDRTLGTRRWPRDRVGECARRPRRRRDRRAASRTRPPDYLDLVRAAADEGFGFVRATRILPAELGSEAPLIGAALVAG